MEGSGASGSGRRKMPAYSDIGFVGEACTTQAVLNMGKLSAGTQLRYRSKPSDIHTTTTNPKSAVYRGS